MRFTNGAHRLILRGDLHMQSLYRARFGNRTPAVRARGGVVTILHSRFSNGEWLEYSSECPAEVTLNARIPWEIEIRGGASRLLADLRALRLESLRVDGGAGRLEMLLPVSSGTVAVLVLGGASNVTIRCPEGVSARLRVQGGVTNLTFDGRRVGADGGDVNLRNRCDAAAASRYDIAITGGANNVTIEQWSGRDPET